MFSNLDVSKTLNLSHLGAKIVSLEKIEENVNKEIEEKVLLKEKEAEEKQTKSVFVNLSEKISLFEKNFLCNFYKRKNINTFSEIQWRSLNEEETLLLEEHKKEKEDLEKIRILLEKLNEEVKTLRDKQQDKWFSQIKDESRNEIVLSKNFKENSYLSKNEIAQKEEQRNEKAERKVKNENDCSFLDKQICNAELTSNNFSEVKLDGLKGFKKKRKEDNDTDEWLPATLGKGRKRKKKKRNKRKEKSRFEDESGSTTELEVCKKEKEEDSDEYSCDNKEEDEYPYFELNEKKRRNKVKSILKEDVDDSNSEMYESRIRRWFLENKELSKDDRSLAGKFFLYFFYKSTDKYFAGKASRNESVMRNEKTRKRTLVFQEQNFGRVESELQKKDALVDYFFDVFIEIRAETYIYKYIWNNLYEYQKKGVLWLLDLYSQHAGGILADEMGLGKTLQAVAFIAVLHINSCAHFQDLLLRSSESECLNHKKTSSFMRKAEENHESIHVHHFNNEKKEIEQKIKSNFTRLDFFNNEGCNFESDSKGILIVCPSSLLQPWMRELHLWYPLIRVNLFHQKNNSELIEALESAFNSNGVLLTSYETLRTHINELLKYSWNYVILDEGQKIRNPNSQVTLAVKKFNTSNRLIISATPIQNNLVEFWAIFDFVVPGLLGTLPLFMEHIALPINLGSMSNASHQSVSLSYRLASILRDLTTPFLLRRTKSSVQDLLKLPSKNEQVIFCNMAIEQFEAYIEFLEIFKNKLKNRYDESVGAELEKSEKTKKNEETKIRKMEVFFAISVLRKISNHPDLLLEKLRKKRSDKTSRKKMIRTTDDFSADKNIDLPKDLGSPNRSGKMKVLIEILSLWKTQNHRVLIFSQTIQMLSYIEQYICISNKYKYLKIDGSTPIKNRQNIIDNFNFDQSFYIMLLTSRVGGLGLNLTGANRIIIFDPDWNPMTDNQARERCWRIGQKREVLIYRLISNGTVEEKIYHRQIFKYFLSLKILDDPRQKKFFKVNELHDLFEFPSPIPGYDVSHLRALNPLYREVLDRGFKRFSQSYNESADYLHNEIENFNQSNTLFDSSTDISNENDKILQMLYNTQGIQSAISQDNVEMLNLDEKLVEKECNEIAENAVDVLKRSQQERMSFEINIPTWTGKKGRAGIPMELLKNKVLKMTRNKLPCVSADRSMNSLCLREKKEKAGLEARNCKERNNSGFVSMIETNNEQKSMCNDMFEGEKEFSFARNEEDDENCRNSNAIIESLKKLNMLLQCELQDNRSAYSLSEKRAFEGRDGRKAPRRIKSVEESKSKNVSNAANNDHIICSNNDISDANDLNDKQDGKHNLEKLECSELKEEKGFEEGAKEKKEALGDSFSKCKFSTSLSTFGKARFVSRKANQVEINLAREILNFFFSLKHKSYVATTGEVLEYFYPIVPHYQKTVFKAILKRICRLEKSDDPLRKPSRWSLRNEFIELHC